MKSFVEKNVDIKSWDDLIQKIIELNIDSSTDYLGNGKSYSMDIGKGVWARCLLATTPNIPENKEEEEEYIRIYKLLYTFTKVGEYPLLQQLCNYLGYGMDEFMNIMQNGNHPYRNAYYWAYNVFESCSQNNAMRSNGNKEIRMWLDKSREGKITAQEKVELMLKQRKMDVIEDRGREVYNKLLEEGE